MSNSEILPLESFNLTAAFALLESRKPHTVDRRLSGERTPRFKRKGTVVGRTLKKPPDTVESAISFLSFKYGESVDRGAVRVGQMSPAKNAKYTCV